jgi:hypothetical protein
LRGNLSKVGRRKRKSDGLSELREMQVSIRMRLVFARRGEFERDSEDVAREDSDGKMVRH